MSQKLLTIFFVLILSQGTSSPYATAQRVAEDEAREAAAEVLQRGGIRISTKAKRVKPAELRLLATTTATYLFSDGADGFALMSADRRLPACLGYGTGPKGAMPLALSAFVATCDRRLRLLPDAPAASPNLESDSTPATFAPVAPLLTTTRHQEAPYNRYCPHWLMADSTLSEQPCVVGCVATALEQVLTYHRRVYTLRDTLHGWEALRYTIPDVLPGQSVDSRLIRSAYTGEEPEDAIDAVARLSYWLGVAAHMQWGLGESGAVSRRCVEPLTRAFGLGYVFYADSYKYAPEDWLAMLRAELYAGRPIYYAGNTMRLNGHAFVLDGLDRDGNFHVNWGYGGYYDGYFNLAALYCAEPAADATPKGWEQGFFTNQEAIFIHPDSISVAHPDTLSRTGEELRIIGWQLLEEPTTVAYTPMTLTLENTSEFELTTPLELFTNLPTDTAFLAQGDYVALTSCRLKPHEQATLTIHLRFDEGGARILRLSPDDEHVFDLGAVDIGGYRVTDVSFSDVETFFPNDTTVSFALSMRVNPEGGRMGRILGFHVGEPDYEGEFGLQAHSYYVYLAPGEERRDTVSFRGLEAGHTYRLRVRCPWAVVKTVLFTMPIPDGIASSPLSPQAATEEWYSPDGRRLTPNRHSGIGISRDGRKRLFHNR